MDPIVPAWLSNQFLTECLLKEEGKENVIVTNFIASAAVAPGNNYGSCILRVKVEYRLDVHDEDTHSMYLILKSELPKTVVSDMFDGRELTESNFYYKFLPEAKKLMNTHFIPKNFFSSRFSTIVLDDLKEQGYIMADKVKQLDFDHCCLYVTAAASLHAVSFKVFKQHPELIETIGEEKMFSNNVKAADFFKAAIRNGLRCMSDNMNKMEKFKKYSETVTDITDYLWEMLVEAHKPCKVLNTINQGDPWTPNMMFKYDVGSKVNQIKLLDFQALRVASPVNDLVFFIWTSANHDVRKNSLDRLYKIYLDTFNSKLEQLQCDERLTCENLKYNLELLCPLAIHLVATAPYLYATAAIDLEQLMQEDYKDKGNENPFQQFYSDNYCKNHLPLLLEHMETTGVFQYLGQYQKKLSRQ